VPSTTHTPTAPPARAIVRPPSARMGECLLTHLDRAPIDIGLAREQHSAYANALAEAGLALIRLDPIDDCPDSVFVEDPVVVLDELAVVARPATDSRRAERESLETALRPIREIARLEAPATLEGGDVIHAGRDLFVGVSSRTNEEGVRQLREKVGPLGYTVTGVPVTGCLHLKTGACHIGGGAILANPRWVDTGAFGDREVVGVSEDEPWSANGVLVGETIVVPAGAAKTSALLRERGLKVVEVGLSEMQKAEGSATCLSVLMS